MKPTQSESIVEMMMRKPNEDDILHAEEQIETLKQRMILLTVLIRSVDGRLADLEKQRRELEAELQPLEIQLDEEKRRFFFYTDAASRRKVT